MQESRDFFLGETYFFFCGWGFAEDKHIMCELLYCIYFCSVRKFVDWGCNSNDVWDLNIPVVNYQEWSQILDLMPSKISVVFHRMSHK